MALAYDTTVNDVRQNRASKPNQAREMAIYLTRQLTGIPQKELAVWMNVSSAYTIAKIQQRFREKMARNKALKSKVMELKHYILSNVKTWTSPILMDTSKGVEL